MQLPPRSAAGSRAGPSARPRRADRRGRRAASGRGARDDEGDGDQPLLRGPPHPAGSGRGGGRAPRRAARGAQRAAQGTRVMPGDIPVGEVHLDVREDIRRGHEPFARIMAAVKALAADAALVLRAPFEPIPLYDVLGKRGFAHRVERRAPDDWSVTFYRSAAPRPEPAPVPATPARRRTVLDVRGLEPPQPMVR